ncbi:Phosphatidylinositol 4-phosphate 5-kinase-like protein 1 [Triplophysa tibetana]|uniref:Phosphatidylinositol 4-phosphate 5-kinase-like protein 1 n=1 Tax=Triplophysa tibetana TaxID=1572043 RepID=A0A5A9P3R3_9TELE|nr:Phosphatidylinositol 4-phosphate 5-kinase-like protein 1 [Triplophysa tibetana]
MSQTESEMSGPSVSRPNRNIKRRRWGGLRQRWKMLGLFEIDQQHEFYSLTCMMKVGLCAAIQNTIDNPLPDELSEDDYNLEVTQIHKDFIMETYAGPVFASLRRSLGMTEKEYQQSLSSESSYLQFISNSKSKADFFLTNDKRFFLKTQSKREVRFLLSILRIYMEHLEKYPHSLLVKFLDQQRLWLLHQVEIDTAFLQTLNVLDYSLLLAHHPLHQDELSQNLTFETLIKRTKKSVNATSSPTHVATPTVPGVVAEDDSILLSSELNCATSQGHATEMHCCDNGSYGGENIEQPRRTGAESADLQVFKAQNRRLLPNFKNPLHVIDGPDQRYFIGIIDIFTVYGFRKRLEHLWKRLRYPRQTCSTRLRHSTLERRVTFVEPVLSGAAARHGPLLSTETNPEAAMPVLAEVEGTWGDHAEAEEETGVP